MSDNAGTPLADPPSRYCRRDPIAVRAWSAPLRMPRQVAAWSKQPGCRRVLLHRVARRRSRFGCRSNGPADPAVGHQEKGRRVGCSGDSAVLICRKIAGGSFGAHGFQPAGLDLVSGNINCIFGAGQVCGGQLPVVGFVFSEWHCHARISFLSGRVSRSRSSNSER